MVDELYHYGVKGMKWGVRRYQNANGSLTAEGKKRQNKKEKASISRGEKLRSKGVRANKLKTDIERRNRKMARSSEFAKGLTLSRIMYTGPREMLNNPRALAFVAEPAVVGAGKALILQTRNMIDSRRLSDIKAYQDNKKKQKQSK